MTIRLVKRNQQNEEEAKLSEAALLAQMTIKTRSWVNEFKERKAQPSPALLDFRKIN